MFSLEASAAERAAGALSEATLAAGLAAFRADGYVHLPAVIDAAPIDALGEKMLADLDEYEARHGIANNFQGVRPPPKHPHLFAEILFNPIVLQLGRALFGPAVKCSTYGANTAFVGAKEQRIHVDTTQLWPGLDHAPPCHALAYNVPLVDTDEQNGATRVWPGTHLDTRLHSGDRFPTDDMLAAWPRPPERIRTRKGDAVLRDLRCWHQGMPNATTTHRPMLAIVHHAPWWGNGAVEFEEGCEEFLDHPDLKVEAVFSPAPIDYLHQGHSRPQKK